MHLPIRLQGLLPASQSHHSQQAHYSLHPGPLRHYDHVYLPQRPFSISLLREYLPSDCFCRRRQRQAVVEEELEHRPLLLLEHDQAEAEGVVGDRQPCLVEAAWAVEAEEQTQCRVMEAKAVEAEEDRLRSVEEALLVRLTVVTAADQNRAQAEEVVPVHEKEVAEEHLQKVSYYPQMEVVRRIVDQILRLDLANVLVLVVEEAALRLTTPCFWPESVVLLTRVQICRHLPEAAAP